MSEPEEHYRDGAHYDHTYARYKPDVRMYRDLAVASGGPVLELGVGTGRVAIAIARSGIEVVGVDRQPEMLARFRERLNKLPRKVARRVTVHEADLRTVRLGQRFPLIIAPFNVLMHLYTRSDVERALATCEAHLTPGRGRLVFDVLLPDPVSLGRDPNRFYRCRPISRGGRRHAYAEAFEYDARAQIQRTRMRFTPLGDDDDGAAFIETLTQRQLFPAELEALLHYNGFDMLVHDGGFEGEPLDAWSDSQIVIARVRDDET